MDFAQLGSVLLLVFGFGFVIFWHELGHFLAAKWAGVKVEQFAVGFGHALVCWRKGIGFTRGTSARIFEQRVKEQIASRRATEGSAKLDYEAATVPMEFDAAANELGLGETEYRLNWIPLGGYVKMLGQDDLDPNAQSESPRAYNNKPIGKRMVIVSAGVIMNVILAIILFTVLFRMGFDVPPAVVGSVAPGSPAQRAGVQVGDRILSLDGDIQHDFTKIRMTTALLEAGKSVVMKVRRADGKEEDLTITPEREPGDAAGFLMLGVGPATELRGLDPAKLPAGWDKDRELMLAEYFVIKPGDVVTAIDGKEAALGDRAILDGVLQKSAGKPVPLTVRGADAQSREITIKPGFARPFGQSSQLEFAGMVPRASVGLVVEESSARGKLLAGDVITALTIQPGNDRYENLAPAELRLRLLAASQQGNTVDLEVLRNGQAVAIKDLTTQTRLESGTKGLGIGPDYDADHAIIGAVLEKSAADRAGLPRAATIVSIGSQPVQSWHDVYRILGAVEKPGPIPIVAKTASGESTHQLELGQSDIDQLDTVRYITLAMFRELSEPRQTNNPLVAAGWGIAETRDLTLQFYLTIRRMVQGSVAVSNAMGPIGIFHQGSKIANRGTDWLIWFLAMISANLAVVNFLPIPIVDGGLFVFLIVEKIMGKPLSAHSQGIAQIVGLALIATVFLFVTYHDISRLF